MGITRINRQIVKFGGGILKISTNNTEVESFVEIIFTPTTGKLTVSGIYPQGDEANINFEVDWGNGDIETFTNHNGSISKTYDSALIDIPQTIKITSSEINNITLQGSPSDTQEITSFDISNSILTTVYSEQSKLETFIANNCPNLTNVDINIFLQDMTELENIEITNCPNLIDLNLVCYKIPTINFSNLTSLTGFYIRGVDSPSNLLSSVTITGTSLSSIDITNGPILETVTLNDNQISTFTYYIPAILNLNLKNNLLDQSTVDQILSDIDGYELSNGTLDLSGTGNASPTDGTSNANYLSLISKGWTVNIN